MNKMLVNNLSIADFSRYLENHGWQVAFEQPFRTIWRKFNGKQFLAEVVLPKEETLDKQSGLYYALLYLAEYEKITPDAMREKLRIQQSDHISIRVIDDTVKNGTIPLADGVLLFEKAKHFMQAVALSAYKPKASYRSTDTGKVVKEFMDSVRLGQTRVGSYVIELSYPVENIQVPQQEDSEEIGVPFSFSRGVTHHLQKSVRKLKEAVNRYENDPTVFAHLITDGVSSNLCEAITGLSGVNQQREVEISLRNGDIIDPQLDDDFSISFKPSEIEVIEIAEKYYKGDFTLPKGDIIGIITGTHSSDLEQGGYIRVKTKVQHKNTEIRVDLNAKQYQAALQAHAQGRTVRCIGENLYVNKVGRLHTLHQFSIM